MRRVEVGWRKDGGQCGKLTAGTVKSSSAHTSVRLPAQRSVMTRRKTSGYRRGGGRGGGRRGRERGEIIQMDN